MFAVWVFFPSFSKVRERTNHHKGVYVSTGNSVLFSLLKIAKQKLERWKKDMTAVKFGNKYKSLKCEQQ